MTELREPLRRFASWMEDVLRDNDHKGWWGSCSRDYLTRGLKAEVGELERADARTPTEIVDFIRECCDVANFAMMLADNARAEAMKFPADEICPWLRGDEP